MQKIRFLDEDTISKIAAGEVIERPASVVKELVENSIDAGAARILIEVVDGGKKLIKVVDDGCGICPEDLPLAFAKHATSKISGAKDLGSISTLGFRGEALSSIAGVARSVEVYTKPRSSLTGTYLLIENGKISQIKEAGCPAGTSIAVKDLFHNVPARLKYLKSSSGELARVTETVTEMAIIDYDISFELFSGRHTIFKSNRSDAWNDVLLKIFGLEITKDLLPIQTESGHFSISGAVGGPLSTRSSPDWIFVYVNGRPVSSRMLSQALREAYRGIIPMGKNPIAVVSLEIAPHLIDVNVHPTKREIRFQNEEEIASALIMAVSEALKSRPEIAQTVQIADRPLLGWTAKRGNIGMGVGIGGAIEQSTQQSTLPLEPSEYKMMVADDVFPDEPPHLKILGQILRLYIVAESDQGLMLIDMHAAAERIRFERLMEKYSRRAISQELVQPVTIELMPKEQQLLESWRELLIDIGFIIEHFGGSTYHVRAVPSLGCRLERPEAIHDILRDLFSSGRIGSDATNREDVLKILACRGSVKSGYEMNSHEMKTLITDLYSCQNPHTCPHGRPVAVLLDEAQLERIFQRR
jgi:DNA mismatch repair protein MutL